MTDLLQFAGRFHPLLVHLPIGILLLAGVLELVAWTRARLAARTDPSRHAPPPLENGVTAILVLGAVTAVAAAVAGFLLGTTGGYAGDTYTRHFWLGIAVAAGACGAAAAGILRVRRPGRRWQRAYATLLAATIVLLTVTAHLGATLAHGEGYLTNHAPPLFRSLLAPFGAGAAAGHPAVPPDQAVVYTALVEPILQARCVSCHGPNKTEGGLRLDTPEGIGRGGDEGAVFVAGRAAASEIVRRMWLPAAHPDVMPPRGHRAPTPAEAAVLRWWIDQGASFDRTIADAELSPEITPIVEALVGPIERGPTIPAVEIGAPDPEAIAAARQAGLSLTPIAEGAHFLYVHCTSLGRACDDRRLRALAPLAPHVLWLDLGGTSVTDAGLGIVSACSNLTQLHLQRTPITDAGLPHLEGLQHLEYLNLYGTSVTDDGVMRLGNLRKLRTLYLWQSAVTPDGVTRLSARLPRLQVELGQDADLEPGAAP